MATASCGRFSLVRARSQTHSRLPMTTATLSELRSILGDRILGDLVGVPAEMLAACERTTQRPATVARIDMVGQVVWYLKGTYDDEGIRRWFGRCRPQLRGKSPAEHLGGDWLADSRAATKVLDLAKGLAS